MRAQIRTFYILLLLAVLTWLLPLNRLLSHQSDSGTIFGRYSASYMLLLAGYAGIIVLILLAAIFSRHILRRAPLHRGGVLIAIMMILIVVWGGFIVFAKTRNTFHGALPMELILALILLSLLFAACALLLTIAPAAFTFRRHVLPMLLTTLFTLIAAEIMLRVAFPTMIGPFLYDQINNSSPNVWTEYTWFGRPANAEYLLYGNGGTWSVFTINSRGISDQEYSYEKPPGVYRILLIGDSMIESKEVFHNQRFHTLVEERLRAEGHNVEIIAAGVSGIGTVEELLYLQHEGCGYQPDMVILGAFATNDIGNNHRVTNIWQTHEFVFAPEQYDLLYAKSYYELDANGVLVLRNVPTILETGETTGITGWLHGLLGRTSRLYLALHYAGQRQVRLLNEPLPIPPQLHPYYDDYTGIEPPAMRTNGGVNLMTYIQPDTPIMADAWTLTEALVAEMQRISFDCGAEVFAAMVFPPRLDADQQEANVETRLAQLRAEDPFWQGYSFSNADIRFNNLLIGMGVPTLNMQTTMQGEDAGLFLYGDGHFNPAGHHEAARVMYDWLIASDWLP